MEELRVKLKCKTSHILVGGANDELVMNHTTKMREAVTQKLVDRCVLVCYYFNLLIYTFYSICSIAKYFTGRNWKFLKRDVRTFTKNYP